MNSILRRGQYGCHDGLDTMKGQEISISFPSVLLVSIVPDIKTQMHDSKRKRIINAA